MNATKIERALVTGATGFVGSALVARLAAEGIRVTGLSRHGGPGAMVADVRRFAEVRRALEEARPTHVFHLAGDHPSQVAEAADLASSLELNAGGGANLVAAAAEVDCRMVIVLGSAEEYGAASAPWREEMREQPTSGYGASKLAATRAALAAGTATGCPVAVARATAGYGPGQPADMLVSALFASLLAGKPFFMTAGDQTRDFVFVEDIAEGLVRLARTPQAGAGVWNLGSGDSRPVREVAELAQELVGAKGLLQLGAVPPRPGEPVDYAVDMTATRSLLGWQPQVGLVDGLRRTLTALRR